MKCVSGVWLFFFHDSLAIKHTALPKCSLLDIFLWDSEINIVFVILKINVEFELCCSWGILTLLAQHLLK